MYLSVIVELINLPIVLLMHLSVIVELINLPIVLLMYILYW